MQALFKVYRGSCFRPEKNNGFTIKKDREEKRSPAPKKNYA